MSCSGTWGKVAIISDNTPEGVINQALLKLTPTERVLGLFLKLWMESSNFQQSLSESTYGAAIKNVASVKTLKGLLLIMSENVEYEVALSFAGEQREYVEEVARVLQSWGIDVFYDDSEDLWGKNLTEELQDVFENRANYVVMFISKEYVEKAWPRHERKSALSRAVQERREYILPVRFDETPVPGLPTDIAYKQAEEHEPAEIAAMLAAKLGVSRFEKKASDVPPPRMTSFTGEAVFDYSNHNGRYVIGHGTLEFETEWTKASNTSIHVYNDPDSINGVAIAEQCTSIEQISNARSLDYTSRCRTPQRGQIVVWRNKQGFYAATHVLEIKDKSRGDQKDELRFRYVIQSDGSDNFTGLGNMSGISTVP